jgi:DNA-binding response OmpR family regulator
MLLQASGYDVTSALGFRESIHHCERGEFDLFILGHSIPLADKEALIDAFRKSCPGLIVSLRKTNESDVHGADYYVEPRASNTDGKFTDKFDPGVVIL